ncbi:unnamed protein product [Prorocentrum cordatum]|uniref:Uncharacterized protein n=1 Tax=Prorocentrum cordatum TaxID=2364126 RepID=A0ABN9XR01_9DINO|nr:unnamed protein product [Polarella glacialis]
MLCELLVGVQSHAASIASKLPTRITIVQASGPNVAKRIGEVYTIMYVPDVSERCRRPRRPCKSVHAARSGDQQRNAHVERGREVEEKLASEGEEKNGRKGNQAGEARAPL